MQSQEVLSDADDSDTADEKPTAAKLPSRHPSCIRCGRPLQAIGRARRNGKQSHDDWTARRYHKQCWVALQPRSFKPRSFKPRSFKPRSTFHRRRHR